MNGSRLTRQEASYWLAHEHNLSSQRCRRDEVLFDVGQIQRKGNKNEILVEGSEPRKSRRT
jgi:hypothetical protein